MKCSGGNPAFGILDDESRPWPVTKVDSSVTIQWKLTAAHSTSTWEYFLDGQPFAQYDQGRTQPPSNISHTLTNLPQGQHTLLARWNVADTAMAFYSCVDLLVGEGGGVVPGPILPEPDPDPEPGKCVATPWSSSAVYNGGDQVSHDGNIYEAKWWTQGENPAQAGDWGVWKLVAPCDTNGTDPLPEPDPQPEPEPEPGPGLPEPDPEPEPGKCEAAAWSSSTAYTGGQRVSYEGNLYEAKYWSQGDNPANAGEWGAWKLIGPCVGNGGTDPAPGPGDPDPEPYPDPTDPPAEPGDYVVGYFTNWGIYQRDYQVKNIVDSGSADKLTHILYAFGNVQNGRCTIGDSYADYEKAFTAEQSVDGVADKWDDPLRGNFNQLKKLKAANPNLKVLWSFGGWTWSGGFGQASANAKAFADSCYDLVNDPRWEGVFDGIDIDWEYPNACGLTCDNSGFDSLPTLMKALRDRFGDDLVTAAITADASSGGKLDAADYAGAAQYVDFYMPMTYDYFGAWNAKGPTAPHSPLTAYDGIPQQGFNTTDTIAKLRGMDIPSDKLLLGLGFYGRGWTGVTDPTPGGSAGQAAPGSYEAGIEDYKVLKTKCPSTGEVGGTAYAFCNGEWWSYDTPETIAGKMDFARDQGLAGAFFWELSGDTANGELINAIYQGLPKN